MEQKGLAGKAQTVLGVIDGKDLGMTTCHEHILWDIRVNFQEPDSEEGREMAQQPISLDNLYWVRAHSHSNIDNMVQMDEELAKVIVDEVPAEAEENCREAAESCPVEAIIIEE